MPGSSPVCRADQSHSQWVSLWVCHTLGHYVLVIFTPVTSTRGVERAPISQSLWSHLNHQCVQTSHTLTNFTLFVIYKPVPKSQPPLVLCRGTACLGLYLATIFHLKVTVFWFHHISVSGTMSSQQKSAQLLQSTYQNTHFYRTCLWGSTASLFPK